MVTDMLKFRANQQPNRAQTMKIILYIPKRKSGLVGCLDHLVSNLPVRLSIHRYVQDVSVNKAKGLRFPSVRGTWLPSWDWQFFGGIAVNWISVRVCLSRATSGKLRIKILSENH